MYTFKKEERLCSKKLLDKLFQSRSSFVLYPFRIIWLHEELTVQAQLVISIPKRNFKKAVDRNLLKRRIREIYRLHKTESVYSFLDQKSILLGINYIGKEISEYTYLKKKLLAAFEKLQKSYSK